MLLCNKIRVSGVDMMIIECICFNIICPLFQCYEWALRKCQQLDWSENSAKAFVMIGDCLPHPPSYTDQSIYWGTELDVLIGMGVKVIITCSFCIIVLWLNKPF